MRHRSIQLWLAALISVILVGTGSPAWAGNRAQHAERHPHFRFGVVEAYYRPGDALDLGVGWERIIFEWARFQPNGPDEYRTEAGRSPTGRARGGWVAEEYTAVGVRYP